MEKLHDYSIPREGREVIAKVLIPDSGNLGAELEKVFRLVRSGTRDFVHVEM